MHRIWQIPELLVHIIAFLPASSISAALNISHHFRTTLKANLPPTLRCLPDPPNTTEKHKQNRVFPQDVRNKAAAFGTHDVALPPELKMEDTYYFWREEARSEVLDALAPHLHPALGKHVTRLVDGFDALAAGETGMVLQVEMPYHQLYELVQGGLKEGCNEFLARRPPTVVTVFCLGGASWDLLYANVKYRDYGGVKRFSVRVERGEGVRMGDVVEELRGTLVVDGMGGGLGQDVTLVWVFGDGADV
ncbi:hypothetical protein E8E13_005763 [Curvularia kusanoi]|uniref:F-box domain-containing protein n=1 Tax=Curvularia kusanoi TaxID=90978 RepID=A0A9P4W966_CURKU|nr:hypothetical protein E8E13_005763 [Curvularia kusanoi]